LFVTDPLLSCISYFAGGDIKVLHVAFDPFHLAELGVALALEGVALKLASQALETGAKVSLSACGVIQFPVWLSKASQAA